MAKSYYIYNVCTVQVYANQFIKTILRHAQMKPSHIYFRYNEGHCDIKKNFVHW